MNRIELEPVDRVEITLLMDNVTDPLLVDEEAYEQALVGTPVADPSRPLELLRTVHSFDPCLACAVHVLDAERAGQRMTVTVEPT